MRRTTIRDVAREAGVSVTTVSVVLGDSSRPVSAALRDRVREVAERLDYHPSAVAQGLVRQQTNTIGVLFGEVEEGVVGNYYAAGVLAGVVARAQRSRLDLHLFTMRWKPKERPAQRVLAQQPDGVLILVHSLGSDMAPALHTLGLPVVCISTPGVDGISYVDIDNVCGIRLAIDHLLELGHTRIGHIAASRTQQSVVIRQQAMWDRLNDVGLTVPPEWIVGNTFASDEIFEATRAMMARPERPTALLCASDTHAFQALRALKALGLRTPEDVSVIGFDDFPSAPVLSPPLTTVRQDLAAIGREAVELLLRRIAGREPEHRLLAPELVVRASTGPPA
jgi:LacI family transcriptional regulator